MTRLFVSHSWTYSNHYDNMVSLLDESNRINFTNYSIDRDKAFEGLSKLQLQEKLKNQIRPVNCVIIIGGMWTNYSDWIQFEMDFASSIGKPILGVKPFGAQVMPMAVVAKSDKIVNWSTISIVQGIREIGL